MSGKVWFRSAWPLEENTATPEPSLSRAATQMTTGVLARMKELGLVRSHGRGANAQYQAVSEAIP